MSFHARSIAAPRRHDGEEGLARREKRKRDKTTTRHDGVEPCHTNENKVSTRIPGSESSPVVLLPATGRFGDSSAVDIVCLLEPASQPSVDYLVSRARPRKRKVPKQKTEKKGRKRDRQSDTSEYRPGSPRSLKQCVTGPAFDRLNRIAPSEV